MEKVVRAYDAVIHEAALVSVTARAHGVVQLRQAPRAFDLRNLGHLYRCSTGRWRTGGSTVIPEGLTRGEMIS